MNAKVSPAKKSKEKDGMTALSDISPLPGMDRNLHRVDISIFSLQLGYSGPGAGADADGAFVLLEKDTDKEC